MEFKYFESLLNSNHFPIVNFFRENEFDLNMPVLTYLSVLAPNDRCVIIEQLFDPEVLNSVMSDKLLLAYVTNGKIELAKLVIENSLENGENPFNIMGLQSKLDLGRPPVRNREQRIKIYRDFLTKDQNAKGQEFLRLVIDFCNRQY